MAWEGSDRRSRLPPDWPRIRAARLKIDGYRCTWKTNGQRCTATATEVDHRTAKTDDHRLSALRSLCTPHHRAKSSAEGVAARRARQALMAERLKLPVAEHPGHRRRTAKGTTCPSQPSPP